MLLGKKKFLAIAAAAVLGLGSSQLFACPGQHAGANNCISGNSQHCTPKIGDHKKDILFVLSNLDLTKDQITHLNELVSEFYTQMGELKEDSNPEQIIADALSEDGFDANSYMDDKNNEMASVTLLEAEYFEKMAEVLTKEQRVELKKLLTKDSMEPTEPEEPVEPEEPETPEEPTEPEPEPEQPVEVEPVNEEVNATNG